MTVQSPRAPTYEAGSWRLTELLPDAGDATIAERLAELEKQVAEFERVQRVGDTKRRAQRDLAGSRVTLRLLEEERGYRVREEKPVSVFLERLLTL